MSQKFFDRQAFLNLAAMQGATIELCTRQVIAPAKPEYGLVEQVGYQCVPLSGHIVYEQSSQIAINETDVKLNSTQLTAYIQPKDFEPRMVNEHSLFRVFGAYYQPELLESVVGEGDFMLFKYRLNKPNKSMSMPFG